MMKKLLTISVLMLAMGALAASPVQADLIGFTAITENSPVDPAFGEAQMFFEVGENSPYITFYFVNLGPEESSIERIFFSDETSLFNTNSVIGFFTDSGVDFAGYVYDPDVNNPGSNFPAGEEIDWQTTFWYEAAPPPSKTGINPNETITFSLLLNEGKDYQSVLSALQSGDLRIGIHVISWADTKSESFVNVTPPGGQVPEPMTAGLLGLGLAGFFGVRWARRKNQAL